MKYSILLAIDRNSSLKRVGYKTINMDEMGKATLAQSTEWSITQSINNGIYICPADVDVFANEVKSQSATATNYDWFCL